eukprot:scaffold154489_cov20-Prasinocladus_malaysianus.AAC.2
MVADGTRSIASSTLNLQEISLCTPTKASIHHQAVISKYCSDQCMPPANPFNTKKNSCNRMNTHSSLQRTAHVPAAFAW